MNRPFNPSPWTCCCGVHLCREVLLILVRSTMDQSRDCISMEQTVTVTFPHGCTKEGKDDEAAEKRIYQLIRICPIYMQRKTDSSDSYKFPVFIITFFPPECMAVTAYLCYVIPPLFPTRLSLLALLASSYFQTTKATNGRLFATSTIYWKSVPRRQSPHHAIHYSGGRTMRGCGHKFWERMNFSPFF